MMLSWWGRGDVELQRDSQGANTDAVIPIVLDAAADSGMRVSWHIEPYGGRSPETVLADLLYLNERYGKHRAIWRDRERHLPLVYLYDVSAEHSGGRGEPLQHAIERWRETVAAVRGGPADAILLSLYHDRRDVDFVIRTGLDGAYTYFAVIQPPANCAPISSYR